MKKIKGTIFILLGFVLVVPALADPIGTGSSIANSLYTKIFVWKEILTWFFRYTLTKPRID